MDEVKRFNYLRSVLRKVVLCEGCGFEDDIEHTIKCGWTKWIEASSILCDKSYTIRLKNIFYNIAMKHRRIG